MMSRHSSILTVGSGNRLKTAREGNDQTERLFLHLEIQTPRNFWAFWVMGTIGGKLGVLVRTAGKLVRRPASNVLLAVWEDI